MSIIFIQRTLLFYDTQTNTPHQPATTNNISSPPKFRCTSHLVVCLCSSMLTLSTACCTFGPKYHPNIQTHHFSTYAVDARGRNNLLIRDAAAAVALGSFKIMLRIVWFANLRLGLYTYMCVLVFGICHMFSMGKY